MKKTLLTIAIILGFAVLVNAQTGQGTILAGGTASLDIEDNKSKSGSTTTDNGNTTEISINPQLGYFVLDGLVLGLELGISSRSFKPDQSNNDSKSTSLAIGPFVKYYHSSGFFGLGSIGFGSSKFEQTNGAVTTEFETSLFSWRIGAGYAVFFNDNVALEPMISYGSYSLKEKDSDPEVKNIENGIRLGVGFQIFLN